MPDYFTMLELNKLSDKIINQRVAKALGFMPKNVYQNKVAVKCNGINYDYCNFN